MRGDSDIGMIEEILDLVAADEKHCILGQWRVIRVDDEHIAGHRRRRRSRKSPCDMISFRRSPIQ